MNLRDHCTTKQIDLMPRLFEATLQKQGLREDGFPATTR
jgi:hypothetical protein